MSAAWEIVLCFFIAYVVVALGKIANNTRRIDHNTKPKTAPNPDFDEWWQSLQPPKPKVPMSEWVIFALLCAAGPLLLLFLALR